MNSYERKQANRRDRLNAAADRAEGRSNEAYKRADMSVAATGIPFGQPILVGHHSEGRHRAAIKRASELRGKAAAVGTGGISSDDPDAINKLKEKLAKLERDQAEMKAANKVTRKWSKKGVTHESTGDDFEAFAKELAEAVGHPVSHKLAKELMTPQWGNAGPIGFPPYRLTNNNAEIKRLKNRIEQLEKASEAETKEHDFQGVCKVVENVEENRVQFIFDGKPSAEVRGIMKDHGFRWAPSQGAWQRKLTGNARYSARLALQALGVQI